MGSLRRFQLTRSTVLIALLSVGGATGCGGMVTSGHGELQSLRVGRDPATLPVGGSLPLWAIGHYSDGVDVDLTDTVSWASSPPSIVCVLGVPGAPQMSGLARGLGKVTATMEVEAMATSLLVEVVDGRP